MSDGFVLVQESATGKKIHNRVVALAGEDHYQQVVVDETAERRFGVTSSAVATVTASGDTTVHTPAAGKFLRVTWVGLSTASTATETVVTVKLGATTIYQWPLGAPGIFSHSARKDGATDAALVINLSVASEVYVNVDYVEVTP